MFRLIQDQDCHWYLVPSNQINEFYEWDDWMTTCEPHLKKDWPDFDSMRINGPHSVLIKEYEIHD